MLQTGGGIGMVFFRKGKAPVKQRKKTISSRRQIAKAMLIFVVPFLVCLILYNTYTIRVSTSGLVETGKNFLDAYKGPVEQEIGAMQQYIVDIVSNDTEFQQLVYAGSDAEKYADMQKVAERFQRMPGMDTAAVGYIIYDKDSSILKEIYLKKEQYSYEDKEQFRETVRVQAEEEESIKKGWQVQELNGNFYLTRLLGKGDAYILGIYDLERVAKPQNNSRNAWTFFVDDEMNPLTDREKISEELTVMLKKYGGDTGVRTKYLMVCEKVEDLPVSVVYVMPYGKMRTVLLGFPAVMLLASALLIILLNLSFRSMEARYLKPFQKLVETMAAVGKGDMDARMDETSNISEFQLLSNTFNEMVEEIQSLKIASYEYQIEVQQAKLQYYQAQIKPHFFLNCLKNLYGLAETRQYEKIQEMLLVLSRHLHYILRDNFVMRPIEEEIKLVENYMFLQQLTSMRRVSCAIEVKETLKRCEIPPVSILTFVENAVKHAGTGNKPLKIQISIDEWVDGAERFVSVMILDNGVGFSGESLEMLNKNENRESADSHIGIRNVRDRFSLLFGERAMFLFSNMTGSGACIQIFFPASEKETYGRKKMTEEGMKDEHIDC